jgi:maltose O-acetyltransferase
MLPEAKMNELGPQVPADSLLRRLPHPIKRLLNRLYWLCYDVIDFVAELIGAIPSHGLRVFLYRHLLGVQVGMGTSVHRGCRIYRPSGIFLGEHTVINRGVVMDGRMGLRIGNNVSISEDVMLLTLEHDPDSSTFENRGATVTVGDRVFIGVRAIVLPGVNIAEGAVVAAGAVVTRDVSSYTIVGGVPARIIAQRRQDLAYVLDYRKFLG